MVIENEGCILSTKICLFCDVIIIKKADKLLFEM